MTKTKNLPDLTGPVSEWLSDNWDGGDPWGSAMGEAFAICDVLFDMGRSDLIPAELQYRPSVLGADSDDFTFIQVHEFLLYGNGTPEDLSEYLYQLGSYLEACKDKGLDY